MASSDKPTIAIIGGGISGLTLAIALLRRGLNVRIYEQAHAFGEIGAGVAFGPQAVRAMQTCSPDVHAAFRKVSTHNQFPEKQDTWFDFLDAWDKSAPVGKEKWLFSLECHEGANAVHRAHFLIEMVRLVPEGVTQFKKHLNTIEQPSDDGKVKLIFHDGTTAEVDAVVGCDGIKARTRAWLLGGDDEPGAQPVYTRKYAYRGLVPMARAVEELGEDLVKNSKMHLGQHGHIVTFPVDHGATMNVVAFWTSDKDWPDARHLTRPSEKQHIYDDFKDFGPTVQKIIDMLEPNLDCWAIFDTGDYPLQAYNKGRVCCLGDAAHATSPHHGAGAGICIEDAAIMAELLAESLILQDNNIKGIETAFQVFSDVRKVRANWLVHSSRRTGNLYELRAEGVGDDVEKIRKECAERDARIWDAEIDHMVAEAKQALAYVLKV